MNLDKNNLQLTAADFHPKGDVILVLPESDTLLRDSGFVMMSHATDKPNIGTIVAIGPGKVDSGIPMEIFLKLVTAIAQPDAAEKIVEEVKKLQDIPLKVGDKILYGKFSGADIKIGSTGYRTMSAKDVLFTIGSK